MFYKIIKNFFLKKIVIKRLHKEQLPVAFQKINSIGLLVDETYFSNTPDLVAEILSYGFDKEQLKVVVYKDKIKSKDQVNAPFFAFKNCSMLGEINKEAVNDFLDQTFDVLLNYYDVNKYSLVLCTLKSKAKFKVGFETVDKRVNQLIISESVEHYKAWTAEVFKYLKILNKI